MLCKCNTILYCRADAKYLSSIQTLSLDIDAPLFPNLICLVRPPAHTPFCWRINNPQLPLPTSTLVNLRPSSPRLPSDRPLQGSVRRGGEGDDERIRCLTVTVRVHSQVRLGIKRNTNPSDSAPQLLSVSASLPPNSLLDFWSWRGNHTASVLSRPYFHAACGWS